MLRLPKTLLLSLIALLLLACSEPRLSPIPAGGTIMAFGDSLTKGVGARKENSYPAVLQELTGISVINSGISGETTAGGLARIAESLDRTRPSLLILLEGGNDILRNVSHQDIRTNLARMIEQALMRDIEVILLGVPEKNLFSSSAAFYPELAKEYGLAFDDTLVADLLRNPAYKSDPIHLNSRGYREMARRIKELLVAGGALP